MTCIASRKWNATGTAMHWRCSASELRRRKQYRLVLNSAMSHVPFIEFRPACLLALRQFSDRYDSNLNKSDSSSSVFVKNDRRYDEHSFQAIAPLVLITTKCTSQFARHLMLAHFTRRISWLWEIDGNDASAIRANAMRLPLASFW